MGRLGEIATGLALSGALAGSGCKDCGEGRDTGHDHGQETQKVQPENLVNKNTGSTERNKPTDRKTDPDATLNSLHKAYDEAADLLEKEIRAEE